MTSKAKRGAAFLLAFVYLFLSAGYIGLLSACRSLERYTEQWVYISLAIASAIVCCVELFSYFSHRRRQKNIAGRIYHGIQDLLILAYVVPMGLSIVLYEGTFFHHQTTPQEIIHQQGNTAASLNVLDMPFKSNMGQRLSGHLYYEGGDIPDSILVLAHGNGVGYFGYMNVVQFFAKNGYGVFAYNATGYDDSEGLSTRGLPQGVIDLDYAMRFLWQNPITAGKTLLLFGHSWGGYAVGAVLNLQPDVAAVISLAGFDHSSQILEYHGGKMIGDAASFILPHLSLYEGIKFGQYASFSAINGFNKTNAKIIILHSADDETVPIQLGYEQYRKHYGNNDRFSFIRFENCGHEGLFNDQNARMILELLNQ